MKTKKNWSKVSVAIGAVLALLLVLSACENPFLDDLGDTVITDGTADLPGTDDTPPADDPGETSDPAADAITAHADVFEVLEHRTATIPVSVLVSNDTDPTDNPPLVIIAVSNAVGGVATLGDSTISFECSVDAGQAASFEYTVENAGGLRDTGVVSLTVAAIPPIIAEADTFDLVQGEELLVLASVLAQNDVDSEGRPLSVVAVSNAVGGTVSLDAGDVTFVSTSLAYEVASFQYTVQNDLGTTGTGTVYLNVEPLPAIEALIYDDSAGVDAVLAEYQPPTMQEVFDSWARFDGNNYYENKDAVGISGNASAWELLSDPDRVSMPLNVWPFNGFVSPEALENYKLEVTLSSPNGDNDTIGVVIAFTRIDGVNYSLTAVRNHAGNDPRDGWGVVYHEADDGGYYSSSYMWTIDSANVGGTSSGWYGAETRVKIERAGDLIKAYTTNWNDTGTYQAASLIEIDLTSDARLEKFRGPQPYGYVTYSQPDSTYLDVQLTGNMDANVIMDISAGRVWEWVDGSGWVLTARSIQDELGYVREVTNPETGKTYLIKEDEIILL